MSEFIVMIICLSAGLLLVCFIGILMIINMLSGIEKTLQDRKEGE